jgi:uncharacterized membrane protein YhaH (DUF805 family)
MHEYIQALKLYAVFDGRATSREYWRFILLNSLIWLGLCGLDLITGVTLPDMGFSLTSVLYNLSGLDDQAKLLTEMYGVVSTAPIGVSGGSGLLGTLYDCGTMIPVYAITVRRLHDCSRRGWWALLNAIPLLGSLLLLPFMLAASTPGDNEYNLEPSTADPKMLGPGARRS